MPGQFRANRFPGIASTTASSAGCRQGFRRIVSPGLRRPAPGRAPSNERGLGEAGENLVSFGQARCVVRDLVIVASWSCDRLFRRPADQPPRATVANRNPVETRRALKIVTPYEGQAGRRIDCFLQPAGVWKSGYSAFAAARALTRSAGRDFSSPMRATPNFSRTFVHASLTASSSPVSAAAVILSFTI